MDFKFNETEETIRDMAREFAERFLGPEAEKIEKENTISQDFFNKVAETGLVGISFAEELGGLGLGRECRVIAAEEFAKVSAGGTIGCFSTHLFMETINICGSQAQKEAFLPDCITGKHRGSFAFTEPGTGSDPKQLTATYRREGDFYILNGTKRFITNAGYPGPIIVYAKDIETGACTGFIFDKAAKGYSLSSPWDVVGYKGSPIYDVFMDDIKVPATDLNILGEIGKGFPTLLVAAGQAKVLLCAMFVGIMGGAYELALKYVREKMHRNESIGKFQAIQLKVAQIAAQYESAKLLVYKLGYSANDPLSHTFHGEVATAKAYLADLCVDVTFKCMNMMGAYGVSEEYKVERFMRDALIGPHIEGVSDMQRVIAGSAILKG